MGNTALDWLDGHQPSAISYSDPAGSYCAALTDRGLLAYTGDDAERFLQGQLTCDVAALGSENVVLGACCEPKGRMLASFHLLRDTDGFLLDLPIDVLNPLQTALGKYAMLFRKLSAAEATEHWRRLVVWGADAADALAGLPVPLPAQPGELQAGDGIRLLRLPVVDGWQVWLEPGRAAEQAADILRRATLVDVDGWRLQEIRAGLGWVNANSSALWIPQMLNYAELGAVSFRKGCYTGQEIIARLQYRGSHKRSLRRLAAHGPLAESPRAGCEIADQEGKPWGELVAFAGAGDDEWELLAVLHRDAPDAAQLHLAGLSLKPAEG